MTKLLEREEIDPAWLRTQYLVLLDVMEKMEACQPSATSMRSKA